VIPLPEGHALSVGMFSYRGTLCFSGYADPGALPEAGALPMAINAAALELCGSAGRARTRVAA
jgi:hypothetical protein